MSRQIDFTVSNYQITKILKPNSKINPPHKDSKSKEQKKEKIQPKKINSFAIQKSFNAPIQSPIPQSHKKILDPEIQSLKLYSKIKREKQKKIEKLIATGKIQRQDLNIQKPKKTEQIQKIIIDSGGRIRDEQGNLIFQKDESKQMKINQTLNNDSKSKQFANKQKKKFFQKMQRGSLYDSNISLRTAKKRINRTISGLQFVQEGSISKAMRPQIKEENQQNDLSDLLNKKKESENLNENNIDVINKGKKRHKIKLQFKEVIPQKQWWDQQLITTQSYLPLAPNEFTVQQKIEFHEKNLTKLDSIIGNIKMNLITDQLSTVLLFNNDEQQTVTMPVFLTKQQRKKLKRRRKQQKLKQKHDKIKLGLIEPQKTKLKLSNMAIVMKDEFILDPSKVQAQVRKQIQQRLDKHLESNASKKLTKQKKAEKQLRKLKRDSAKQSRVAIFRIENVQDRTNCFKIQMNAKQLVLNGFFFTPCQNSNYTGPAVVIVQGGNKAIKFYKNLMLKRINWNETYKHNLLTKQQIQQQKIENEKIIIKNKCSLVWQAVIQEKSFNKWKSVVISNQTQAIKLLSERKVLHYWDSVINFKEEK